MSLVRKMSRQTKYHEELCYGAGLFRLVIYVGLQLVPLIYINKQHTLFCDSNYKTRQHENVNVLSSHSSVCTLYNHSSSEHSMGNH